MRILIVEDDDLVADGLNRGLGAAGFSVDRVATLAAARGAMAAGTFDLVVLDLGLPDGDGLQFLGQLRRGSNVIPILVLTARDGLADRIDALDIGADDYLVKPFALPEVVARVRALIRRSRSVASARLDLGELSLDLAASTASVMGCAVDLTRREWSVLECLALEAGRVVRKDRLLEAIARFDQDLSPNAVEVYVSRLRSKLGPKIVIRTVRGLGYRLEDAT
jgi:DNA-binding response OmpR family regulator